VIDNLENCDVYAKYSVQDLAGNSTASAIMDTQTLNEYVSGSSESWVTWLNLQSWTTYYGFGYTLELRENIGDELVDMLNIHLPNPHPECSVSGSLSIEGIEVNDDNKLVIDNAWLLDKLYTCSIYELFIEIGHGDGFWNELDVNWSGAVEKAQTIPGNYPTPEWNNFPIWANSTIRITDVIGEIDLPTINITIPSLPFHFWPDCMFNSEWASLDYVIIETASIIEGMTTA